MANRVREEALFSRLVATRPGIAADVQPKVFERFTRPDHRRTEDEGSGAGLGLSIVAAVAEAHGGSVTLESGLGSTTFTVRLPTSNE